MAVPWQVPEQLSCVSLPSLLPACMRQVDLPRDTEPLMPCKMGVDSLAMPQILSARKGMYQFFLRIEPSLAMAGSLKVHWESSYGTTSVSRQELPCTIRSHLIASGWSIGQTLRWTSR